MRSLLIGILASLVLPISFAIPQEKNIPVGLATQNRPKLIDEILIEHWERNREGRNYDLELTLDGTPSNSKIAFAFAINRAHHFKYDRASEVINQLVAKQPSMLDAWYCKVWLDFRDKKIDAGLLALQEYRKNLDQSALEKDERSEHLKRIGRLSGFADGPAQHLANADTLQRTLQMLTDKLEADEQQILEGQYHAVIDQYKDLTKEVNTTTNDAMTDAKAKQQKDLADLQKELDDLAKAEGSVADTAQKIREKAEKDLSTLSRDATPLERDADRINAQIFDVQYDLDRLYADLFRAQRIAREHDHHDSPYRDDWHRRQIAAISYEINRRQADLRYLQREYDAVMFQLERIRRQMAQIEGMANRHLNQLDDELEGISQDRRRNVGKTKRVSRPPKARNGKINSLEKRVQFLGTYDPFPAEELKQEILNSF